MDQRSALDRWKKGDKFSAAHLNQVVDIASALAPLVVGSDGNGAEFVQGTHGSNLYVPSQALRRTAVWCAVDGVEGGDRSGFYSNSRMFAGFANDSTAWPLNGYFDPGGYNAVVLNQPEVDLASSHYLVGKSWQGPGLMLGVDKNTQQAIVWINVPEPNNPTDENHCYFQYKLDYSPGLNAWLTPALVPGSGRCGNAGLPTTGQWYSPTGVSILWNDAGDESLKWTKQAPPLYYWMLCDTCGTCTDSTPCDDGSAPAAPAAPLSAPWTILLTAHVPVCP